MFLCFYLQNLRKEGGIDRKMSLLQDMIAEDSNVRVEW